MITRVIVLIAALLLAAVAQAELRIAAVGPMSGNDASFGERIRRGTEAAVADINASGGLLGQKLVVEVGDDFCDAQKAVTVARQMADKKVILVVGHDCSDASIAASDVYHSHGIVQISPSSTNPTFTERGLDNVFRACGRDDEQGTISGRYIARYYRDVNVAILHDNATYGKGLAEATRKAMNKLGKPESLYEAIIPGEKDYSAIVEKMKQKNIGLIYYGGYHPEAGLIVRQARALGLKATLMGADALITRDYWTIVGDAGEGTLMTYSLEPWRNPQNKSIVDKFLKQGFKPDGYALHAYAAVQAWAQAVKRSGTMQTSEVAKALKSGNRFNTVLGRIAFDSKGDVTEPGFVVYRWSRGDYDYAKN
ncbi:MAG: branched-chain amino acid ABC transporter substrate-binding protein [Gammaproteobacteria bacterium]|nr:branched-chain amino acid ABC transporter substrate-binding protein [Gammaproteobacteria bacterium]